MKDNLLVSFSGGETSGYMTMWILNNWSDKYNIEVVFANTGEENEATLEFVKKCDEYFGFNCTWVEANVHHGERRGTTHTVVDFDSASRDGEPFEEVIKKYGIPNQAYPHCTRELKTAPIVSYVKNELGWDDFYTAIGIRVDEFDRMSDTAEQKKYLYPLCTDNPTSKPQVNYFWDGMPFRLELKGYQGNCKVCWKKSFRKLATIYRENPDHYKNFKKWEEEYKRHTPRDRETDKDIRFFRGSATVADIQKIAQEGTFTPATDDSRNTNYQTSIFGHELDVNQGQCSESCEAFT